MAHGLGHGFPFISAVALTGYPLKDNGTVAAMFGYGLLPTSAPTYMQVVRTLTGSGGLRAACPSEATAFTTQFIPYSQSGKIYAEMLVSAAPAGVPGANDMYAGVEFFAHGVRDVSTGSFAGVYPASDGTWKNALGNTVTIADYRIGIIYDLDTGDIQTWDSSGVLQNVSYGIPSLTTGVFAALTLRDDFAGFAGSTFTFSLVGAAAYVQLPAIAPEFPSGVRDLFGEPLPSLYLTDGSGDYLADASGDYLIGA